MATKVLKYFGKWRTRDSGFAQVLIIIAFAKSGFNRKLEMMLNNENIEALQKELVWFEHVLNQRFQAYFNQPEIDLIQPPNLDEDPSAYAKLVRQNGFNTDERLILMLTLAPHLKPQVLDLFFIKNVPYDREFTEFGGYLGKYHKGFLPTAETALFIVALNDLSKRVEAQAYFDLNHPFRQNEIILLRGIENGEPLMSSPLVLDKKYIHYLITGEEVPF
ncbi:MAG: hypothetical protein COW03_01700 [Cytophagales bacterium CG12_big_fil_rev_8_21_14_0_65_40_12]|nr:MAG: hypothetical protein COW03_01700 [Cytophagales bacterium CG12_big_fil_rev_8_21_14_0_65_40_12]PIW05707.1 MAG: hypothetical protein COW40_03205 [Cytophagales bacterium CG17_big_fil_post_rev_8_21_14_2_50_40_13]